MILLSSSKKIMNTKKKGFTLIELLVVIVIIGILATLAIVALQQARKNARDAKRIADVRQMQTALELFFNDNQYYPEGIDDHTSGKIATGSSVYMEILPTPPSPNDSAACSTYDTEEYTYAGTGTPVGGVGYGSYGIDFCLGGQTGGMTAGPKCATPGGIIPGACQ